MNTTTTPRALPLLVAAALLAGGCAGANFNQQRMVDTQATVAAVEELDEEEDPEVSLHLKYAKDQIAAARRLLDEGEDEEANRMLERAHADAQLALAMARTERSRKEAREAWAEVEEVSRLFDNEITKAQSQRDFEAAASKLGLDVAKLKFDKLKENRDYSLDLAKLGYLTDKAVETYEVASNNAQLRPRGQGGSDYQPRQHYHYYHGPGIGWMLFGYMLGRSFATPRYSPTPRPLNPTPGTRSGFGGSSAGGRRRSTDTAPPATSTSPSPPAAPTLAAAQSNPPSTSTTTAAGVSFAALAGGKCPLSLRRVGLLLPELADPTAGAARAAIASATAVNLIELSIAPPSSRDLRLRPFPPSAWAVASRLQTTCGRLRSGSPERPDHPPDLVQS